MVKSKGEIKERKRKNFMKKQIVFMRLCIWSVIFIFAVACTGCSAAKSIWEYGKSLMDGEVSVDPEKECYIQTVEDFLAAIDAKDKEAIRDLFAENISQTDSDFNQQMDLLLQSYPGPTDFWDRENLLLAGEYSNHYGSKTSAAYTTFLLISQGDYFWCSMKLTYENDEDPRAIGITYLTLFSAEYYCAVRYEEQGAEFPEDSGLHVLMDYPLDCDIRVVNGNPVKYTSTGTVLDEEEVKSFLQEKNECQAFEAQFGPPNAISTYFVYELPMENSQPRYLELGENKGEIYSAFVVDDIQWLYTLWKKEE